MTENLQTLVYLEISSIRRNYCMLTFNIKMTVYLKKNDSVLVNDDEALETWTQSDNWMIWNMIGVPLLARVA